MLHNRLSVHQYITRGRSLSLSLSLPASHPIYTNATSCDFPTPPTTMRVAVHHLLSALAPQIPNAHRSMSKRLNIHSSFVHTNTEITRTRASLFQGIHAPVPATFYWGTSAAIRRLNQTLSTLERMCSLGWVRRVLMPLNSHFPHPDTKTSLDRLLLDALPLHPSISILWTTSNQ